MWYVLRNVSYVAFVCTMMWGLWAMATPSVERFAPVHVDAAIVQRAREVAEAADFEDSRAQTVYLVDDVYYNADGWPST